MQYFQFVRSLSQQNLTNSQREILSKYLNGFFNYLESDAFSYQNIAQHMLKGIPGNSKLQEKREDRDFLEAIGYAGIAFGSSLDATPDIERKTVAALEQVLKQVSLKQSQQETVKEAHETFTQCSVPRNRQIVVATIHALKSIVEKSDLERSQTAIAKQVILDLEGSLKKEFTEQSVEQKKRVTAAAAIKALEDTLQECENEQNRKILTEAIEALAPGYTARKKIWEVYARLDNASCATPSKSIAAQSMRMSLNRDQNLKEVFIKTLFPVRAAASSASFAESFSKPIAITDDSQPDYIAHADSALPKSLAMPSFIAPDETTYRDLIDKIFESIKVDNNEVQLKNSENFKQDYQKLLDKLLQEIVKLTTDRQSLDESLNTTKKALARLQKDKSSSQQEVVKLDDQLKKLKDMLDKNKKDLSIRLDIVKNLQCFFCAVQIAQLELSASGEPADILRKLQTKACIYLATILQGLTTPHEQRELVEYAIQHNFIEPDSVDFWLSNSKPIKTKIYESFPGILLTRPLDETTPTPPLLRTNRKFDLANTRFKSETILEAWKYIYDCFIKPSELSFPTQIDENFFAEIARILNAHTQANPGGAKKLWQRLLVTPQSGTEYTEDSVTQLTYNAIYCYLSTTDEPISLHLKEPYGIYRSFDVSCQIKLRQAIINTEPRLALKNKQTIVAAGQHQDLSRFELDSHLTKLINDFYEKLKKLNLSDDFKQELENLYTAICNNYSFITTPSEALCRTLLQIKDLMTKELDRRASSWNLLTIFSDKKTGKRLLELSAAISQQLDQVAFNPLLLENTKAKIMYRLEHFSRRFHTSNHCKQAEELKKLLQNLDYSQCQNHFEKADKLRTVLTMYKGQLGKKPTHHWLTFTGKIYSLYDYLQQSIQQLDQCLEFYKPLQLIGHQDPSFKASAEVPQATETAELARIAETTKIPSLT